MANIEELQSVGAVVVEAVYAVKDGVDIGDLVVAQKFVTTLLAAADDIKEDPDSAALEIVSGLTHALAAIRRIKKPETE